MSWRDNVPGFTLERVCYPCYGGEHAMCRHHPNGPQYGRAPEGEPCWCEASGHTMPDGYCTAVHVGDGHGYNDGCGKLAKGRVKVHPRFRYGPDLDDVEVERCGVHLAALRRRIENDQRRRAESQAREERYRREREDAAAAREWARRLREEHGVDAKADGARVVVHAERLHAQLVALEGLLRDVGVDTQAALREEGLWNGS